MEKAIIKAFKAGWEPKSYPKLKSMGEVTAQALIFSIGVGNIVIDPEFWRCLGKGLEWPDGWIKDPAPYFMEEWKAEWHRFIDKIASGGTPDEFFNNLLK